MARAARKRSSDLLTTSQVGRLCRVTGNTVANWVDAGRLPAFRTPGGHRRIRREDLLRFMEENGFPLPAAGEPERRRCLVVDNDPEAAAALERFLTGFDPPMEVRLAPDIFEAGRLSAEFEPDLVLLDLGMPGMDGRELCRRLKDDPLHGETIVVAMADQPSDRTILHILAAGAAACLEKPLRLDTLAAFLDQTLPAETES